MMSESGASTAAAVSRIVTARGSAVRNAPRLGGAAKGAGVFASVAIDGRRWVAAPERPRTLAIDYLGEDASVAFHAPRNSRRFFGSRYVTISELSGMGFTLLPSCLLSEAAVYSASTSLRIENSSTSLPINF